jgi:hypothetical protein
MANDKRRVPGECRKERLNAVDSDFADECIRSTSIVREKIHLFVAGGSIFMHRISLCCGKGAISKIPAERSVVLGNVSEVNRLTVDEICKV